MGILHAVCATHGMGNLFLRLPAAVLLLAEGQRLLAGAPATLPWVTAGAESQSGVWLLVAGVVFLGGCLVRPVAAALAVWIAVPVMAALQTGEAGLPVDVSLLWLGICAALMFGGAGALALDQWLARVSADDRSIFPTNRVE